ncbi:ATP-binding protein [Streptomyces sp. NPDC005805]|uniref:ATP-binding protein n=1 Tax=Streptomyces sp. NPDC005805 TaxID=3157068 RepID=UPI0033CFA925
MRGPLAMALLATPEAVAQVRRTLAAYAGGPCDDLQLCATELVTNVLRHVGEGVPVAVRVVPGERRTRLEVTDPDPRALPVLRAGATVDEEGGRGLALLDAVALRWGVDQGPADKTVWCELDGGLPDDGPTRSAPTHALVLGGTAYRVRRGPVEAPEEIAAETRAEGQYSHSPSSASRTRSSAASSRDLAQ